MSFLGNPCPCGYFLDYINDEENIKICKECGRIEENKYGYWSCTKRGDKEDGTNHPEYKRRLMEHILK